MKIFPSITTTGLAPFFSDWRKKIKELKDFGIKEICFFPTCLSKKEREEAYGLFKKEKIRNIPFIHLRTDMDFNEIKYLVKNFNVRAFNIHSRSEYSLHAYDYSKSEYKDIIFIENVYQPFDEEEIKKFGGICLDFAHLENDRLLDHKKFLNNIKIIEKSRIGCNHISVLTDKARIDSRGKTRYDRHFLEKFSELDYLKKYPLSYFSDFTVLELENDFQEQLEAIKYINDLIKN